MNLYFNAILFCFYISHVHAFELKGEFYKCEVGEDIFEINFNCDVELECQFFKHYTYINDKIARQSLDTLVTKR